MAIKEPGKPFDWDLYEHPESRHMVTTTELYEMFAQQGISRARVSAWMADEWSDADPTGFNARKVGQKRTKYGPMGGRWMVSESHAVAFIENWLESDARSMTMKEFGSMFPELSDYQTRKLAEKQGFIDPDRDKNTPIKIDSLVVGNWLEGVQTEYYEENLGALVEKFQASDDPLTERELEIYAWVLGERADMPMLPASELVDFIYRSTSSGSADIAEKFRVSQTTAGEWMSDPNHPLFDAGRLKGETYEIPNTQVVDYIKGLYAGELSEFVAMDSYRFETTELKGYVEQTYGRELTDSQLRKYRDEYGGWEEKDLDTEHNEWNTKRLDEFITHLDYLDSAYSVEEVGLQEKMKPSAVKEFLQEKGIEYTQETEGGTIYVDPESYQDYRVRLGEGEVEAMFGTGQMWHKSDAAKFLDLTPYEMDKEIEAGNIHAFEDERGFLTQISVDDLLEYQDMLAARPDYMNITQIGREIGISQSQINTLLAEGTFENINEGKGPAKILRSQVEGWWQEQTPGLESPYKFIGRGEAEARMKAMGFPASYVEKLIQAAGPDADVAYQDKSGTWQISEDYFDQYASQLPSELTSEEWGTVGQLAFDLGIPPSRISKAIKDWDIPEEMVFDREGEWGDTLIDLDAVVGLFDSRTGKFYNPKELEYAGKRGEHLKPGPLMYTLSELRMQLENAGWDKEAIDSRIKTTEEQGGTMVYKEKIGGKWYYFLPLNTSKTFPVGLPEGIAPPGIQAEDATVPWPDEMEMPAPEPTSAVPADSIYDFIAGGIFGAGERRFSREETITWLMDENNIRRSTAERWIDSGGVPVITDDTGSWLDPASPLAEHITGYYEAKGVDTSMVTQPVDFGKVVDGDTITLSSGESVRYLGMDSPELGERGWSEYRKANEEFMQEFGGELNVEWTGMRDEYGRPLAYVTNAAGQSATDYIKQKMAGDVAGATQPDYMLDMLFARLYSATRTGDMELAQQTAQEINASGASPEEFHTRGFAAPGESTGPAATTPGGTALKELRTVDEFIDQGRTYQLIDRYSDIRTSENPKFIVEAEQIAKQLEGMGINAEEAATGKYDSSFWDFGWFTGTTPQTPGLEAYGPQPEDRLKFDQPGKGGEGSEKLYVSDTVNYGEWLSAAKLGDDGDTKRKAIEAEWRKLGIQKPVEVFNDQQIKEAAEVDSVQGWLAEQEGIKRGVIYEPLDRYWWPPYLAKPSEADRVESGDYSIAGEAKSLGPKVAGAVIGSAVLTLLAKYSGAIYRASKGKIVLGRFSHSETSLLIRSIVGTYFSAKGYGSTYEAGKAKGLEVLLEDLGISDAVSADELSKLRAQIEGGGLISEGTRLVDPVTGETYDFTASRAPMVSDLVGEGILPTGTFWEQDRMRIEEITKKIDAGGYVSQSDVNVIEKYASDPEYSKQWKRSRGTDLSDILGQAQDVMTEAPPVSAVTDMPAGLSEATPDDLQRLADWQGKPYGAALRFESTGVGGDIADAHDYIMYARSKGAAWAKDDPAILDFIASPRTSEPPDWLKAYVVARREAGVTTEWAEPNRLYAQVQSGEDILSVNKMTGEVFGLPDVSTGAADDIAGEIARPSELDFLADDAADAGKAASLSDISRAHRLIEGSLDDITGDLVKSLKPSVLDTIGKAAAKGGKKAQAVMDKISKISGTFLGAEDFAFLEVFHDVAAFEFNEMPSGWIALTPEEETWMRQSGQGALIDQARSQGFGKFTLIPIEAFGQDGLISTVAIPGWFGPGREIVERRILDAGFTGTQERDFNYYLWGEAERTADPLEEYGRFGGVDPSTWTPPELRPEGQGHKEGLFVAPMPEWVSELLMEHPLPAQADIPIIPGAQEMVILDFGPESFAFKGPTTPGFDPVPIGAMGADPTGKPTMPQDQLLPQAEYPGISQGIPQAPDIDLAAFGFYQTAEMKWEPDPNVWEMKTEAWMQQRTTDIAWRERELGTADQPGQPTLTVGHEQYRLRKGALPGLRESIGKTGDPLLGKLWETMQGRYPTITAGQFGSWMGQVYNLVNWKVSFPSE